MRYVVCEALLPDDSVWRTYSFPLDTVDEAKPQEYVYRVARYFREASEEEGVKLRRLPLRFTLEECETAEDYYEARGPVTYQGGSAALDSLIEDGQA